MTTARLSRALRAATLLAAASLVVSSCGGSDGGDADEPTPTSSTPTPSSTEAGEQGGEQGGPELTEPGSALSFGEPAAVSYRGSGRSTVLRLTVLSAEKGRLEHFRGFNLDDPYTRRASYFYVQVRVRNAGPKRISGGDVPLWGVSGRNTLLPAVRLTSSFERCQTEQMPQRFRPGSSFRTCLVYLSPNRGSLEGVSYRPTAAFDPITWTGEVRTPKAAAKRAGGRRGR